MERILDKISILEYFLNWYSMNASPGKWKSQTIGRGVEFEKVSEYSFYDDFRSINWSATARTGGAIVYKNDFLAPKNVTIYMVVDVSHSMNFGTRRQSKKYVAAEIAALLAFSAVWSGDEIGLVTWPEIHRLPASSHPGLFMNIAESILRLQEITATGSFLDALEHLPNKKCLLFFISDFLGMNNLYQQLEYYAKFHDLIPIIIEDEMEIRLPNLFSFINLKDLESGMIQKALINGNTVQKFRQKVHEERGKVLGAFDSLDLPYMRIKEDYLVEDLAAFFIERVEVK